MSQQPFHLPVSQAARGLVRQFITQIAHETKLRDALLESDRVREGVCTYSMKTSKPGRRRALQKLHQLLGRPMLRVPDVEFPQFMVWEHLIYNPDGIISPPRDPGEGQASVSSGYIVINAADVSIASGVWTMEVPEHALHRLAQRSPHTVNSALAIREVVMDAHYNTLLAGFPKSLPTSHDSVSIKAGDGVFLGKMVYSATPEQEDGLIVTFRPRTWLHEDQLNPDQQPLPKSDDIDDAGMALMTPRPMRTMTLGVDGVVNIVPTAIRKRYN